MSNVHGADQITRDDDFLSDVVAGLTKTGVITGATGEPEYADMAGLVVTVTLPDGRLASIMIEVD